MEAFSAEFKTMCRIVPAADQIEVVFRLSPPAMADKAFRSVFEAFQRKVIENPESYRGPVMTNDQISHTSKNPRDVLSSDYGYQINVVETRDPPVFPSPATTFSFFIENQFQLCLTKGDDVKSPNIWLKPLLAPLAQSSQEMTTEQPDPSSNPVTFEHFLPHISFVLRHVQKSEVLMTQRERRNAIREFNQLYPTEIGQDGKPTRTMGADKLINFTNKPTHLRLQDLEKWNEYALTDKADGEYFLFFVGTTGIFLIRPNWEIRKISENRIPRTAVVGSLLDCELVRKNGQKENAKNLFCEEYAILLFDVQFLGGMDMRQTEFGQRIQAVDLVTDQFRGYPTLDVRTKKFYLSGSLFSNFADLEMYQSQTDYKNDGAIFQPLFGGYKSFNIRKFKRKEDLTIDFLVGQVYSGGFEEDVAPLGGDSAPAPDQRHPVKYELLVYNREKRFVPFCGTEQHPWSGPATFPAHSPLLQPGLITEFRWDHSLSSFLPVRLRPDKDMPNFVDTATGVWEDIWDPLDPSILRGESLVLMRRFHNAIKRKMLEENCRRTTILDLGVGRGGDMHKWRACQIQVYGFDIDQDNLSELRKRASERGDMRTISTIRAHLAAAEDTQTVLDLMKRDPLPHDRSGGTMVNCVVSFFSLTFFFESSKKLSNFLDTVCAVLPIGGLFLGTTFDGQPVAQALKTKPMIQTPAYKIEKFYQDEEIFGPAVNIGFGKKLIITLDETIVGVQAEYLVDFPEFIRMLALRGFRIKESSLFNPTQDAPFLSPSENHLSSLNRSFVFVRENLGAISLEDPRVLSSVQMVESQYKQQNEKNPEIPQVPLIVGDSRKRLGAQEGRGDLRSWQDTLPTLVPLAPVAAGSQSTPSSHLIPATDHAAHSYNGGNRGRGRGGYHNGSDRGRGGRGGGPHRGGRDHQHNQPRPFLTPTSSGPISTAILVPVLTPISDKSQPAGVNESK